jgi:hypothetical protein
MAKITGLGGAFLRADDAKALTTATRSMSALPVTTGRFGWFMGPEGNRVELLAAISVRLRSHALDRRRFGAEIRASV